MNITFIGSGYVGLVSGIIMSSLGHNVTCLDSDEAKIAKLNRGILPIYEPKLDVYLQKSLAASTLQFTHNYDQNLRMAKAIFITVGTPPKESGEVDLKHVYEVIDKICNLINKDCLLVIKSTVPPTSCTKIIDYLAGKNFHFNIAANPEFLREGEAVEDFLNPDRIVIGVSNKRSEEILKEIYLPLTSKGSEIIFTDLVTAELIKYASNSFLATKVAFINEMANLCEKTSANVKDLAFAIGMDQRIGTKFLNVGPGFGGSCFPKDILALISLARNYQVNAKILESVIDSNNQRLFDMINKISHASNGIEDKNIAFLGLTYKAGTDDIRCSPAIEIIKILLSKGGCVRAYDPVGIYNAQKYLQHKRLLYADSAITTCDKADAIVIATEWIEFQELDWKMISTVVKTPIIIDLRNILDPQKIQSIGFQYYSIGR
jgi:UDPglucose 6-dehydrogenase